MATYELESLDLPRLQGRSLQLMAAALENGATAPLLLGRLLRDGGLDYLRGLQLAEPPTFYPLAEDGAETAAPLDWEALQHDARDASADVPLSSVADYARAYRDGRTTPEAIAETVLQAIAAGERDDPPLRAFIAVDREDVLRQARAATERIRSGAARSIFDGVPVAVKDEVDQVPYPTTVGTCFFGRRPATEDSTVVARLRAAGALLIGKTNMNEIGINPDSFNAHHGTVRNPYDFMHHAGGSSSGSAAAVAAGLCPVAVGADGGGSIRIPASLCGVVGLKATFGRVSEFGAAPLGWSVAHLGPLGATVADVALAYAAMAGPDDKDALSQAQPPPSVAGWNATDLRGLRLGVYTPWFDHAAPEVVATCRKLLRELETAGATLHEVEVPALEAMRTAHVVTILAEMVNNMIEAGARWQDFGPPTRVNLSLARAFTAQDYLQAQRVRTQAMAIFARVFAEVDVLLTPATAVVAPLIPTGGLESGWSDLSSVTELMRYAFPGNLTGIPAISFPAGYTLSGLPVGMQAMARPWAEHVLLRVAHVAEQVVARRRPQRFYEILSQG